MADPAETAEITSPIAWQRWLSIQLVRLRKAAGVKQADAAKAIGSSVGKLSYLENGQRPIAVEDLQTLLEVYQVQRKDHTAYVTAAIRALEPGWWDAWTDDDLSRDQRIYVGLEDAASRIRGYSPTVINGLLQTARYAEAVVAGAMRPLAPETVRRLVELRLARQKALVRGRTPLILDVVLDEATLHRQVGGPEVLVEQLGQLVLTAETNPNVNIRVLPYSAGSHPGLFGPFAILDFDWSSDPGVVFLEGPPQAEYLESRSEVYDFSARFSELWALSMDESRSLVLIREIAKGVSS